MIVAMGGVKQTFYWDTTNRFMVIFSIIMTNFPWVAGTSFLIYLAGLQNISPSVIEASKLDNCSTFKRIIKIDLPLLLPQLKYFLIMGIIGGIQNFNLQLIIIQTEHEYSNVLGLYLYNHAMGIGYNNTQYEYASAVGMFIFAITLILTLISNVSKKKER
jgi:ABC-type sugar transport system permease subunit